MGVSCAKGSKEASGSETSSTVCNMSDQEVNALSTKTQQEQQPTSSHNVQPTASGLSSASHGQDLNRPPSQNVRPTASGLSSASHGQDLNRPPSQNVRPPASGLSSASHGQDLNRPPSQNVGPTASGLSSASHGQDLNRLPSQNVGPTASGLSSGSHGQDLNRLPSQNVQPTASGLSSASHGQDLNRPPSQNVRPTASGLSSASHGQDLNRPPSQNVRPTASGLSSASHGQDLNRPPSQNVQPTASGLSSASHGQDLNRPPSQNVWPTASGLSSASHGQDLNRPSSQSVQPTAQGLSSASRKVLPPTVSQLYQNTPQNDQDLNQPPSQHLQPTASGLSSASHNVLPPTVSQLYHNTYHSDQNLNQPPSLQHQGQDVNQVPSNHKQKHDGNQPPFSHSQQQVLNQAISNHTVQDVNQPPGIPSQNPIADLDDVVDYDKFPAHLDMRKYNGATQSVRHISLQKEILSPLAKGVQSVPIFSDTQAKKYADTGFIKPHQSKAQLSLLNVATPADNPEAITKALSKLAMSSQLDNVESKELEAVQEQPLVQPSDQGSDHASDTSSSTGTEEEAIMAVHMQSLSLSALDQQPSSKGEGDLMNASKHGLGRSATMSDTRLLVLKQSSKQTQGKTRSKSQSFLKMSSASLKVFKLKSCMSGGANNSSSDEAGSYKSSLDETANARSDENVSKRKKKQKKKKRKWGMRKSTSDNAKDAETQEQNKLATMKPHLIQQHHPQLGLSPNISRDMMRTDSNTLEWDHFGETILPSGMPSEDVGDHSFGIAEDFAKSIASVEYHPDMLAIFNQIEQEGGPKMTQMSPTRRGGIIDEDKLSLQISLLHLHRKKEDVQKMLKVTQEHLWESSTEVESLQAQLTSRENSNQTMRMENMKMEEKLNRSAGQLLQIRAELETKITVLEREIDRLQKRLQEYDEKRELQDCNEKIESAVQTSFAPLEKPYKQNGVEAELKTLQVQNSYLQKQLCQASEKVDKQRLVSQSFTQLAEYLKFRLVGIEEQLMTEKQQIQRIMDTVSVTNIMTATHNGSNRNIDVVEFDVELGVASPEGNTSAAEIKGHVTWIQQMIGVIAKESGQLENAIKISIEESELERSDLKAELDSMRSEQKAGHTKLLSFEEEVRYLNGRCLQLCEDNDRLEEICVQHATDIKAEKTRYDKMFSRDMSYGQLIVDHQEQEDNMKQQLVAAQEECRQAKTDKIHQLSALQKKCSELITTEGSLRKELEHLREESQHTIGRLQENQTLAISSLQQHRSKLDEDKADHEAELVGVRTAFQQVCGTLMESTQENLELKRHCQSLEDNKQEQDDHLKNLDVALSDTMKQLDDTKTQLQQCQKEADLLGQQCTVVANEKKEQELQIKKEADTMATKHQQYQCQLQHNKRLVEELQQMVKKQEIQHDEVLEELLQRNVEHDKAVEQIQQSTVCIQELQVQLTQINTDKDRLRNMLESQLQKLLAENQQLKAQLQDSQLLANEQLQKLLAENQQLKAQLQDSQLLVNEHQAKGMEAEKDKYDKVHQSTACIQELQMQLTQTNGEKEMQRNIWESQLQGLQAENQMLKAQIQDSQLLVNEHQAKGMEAEKDKYDKVHQSTACIQELQMQLTQKNGEKEMQRNIWESQLQGLQAENQMLKAQLQDSQLLVSEQHAKCFKLSEDLKSATTELTKRDCTINNLQQVQLMQINGEKEMQKTIWESQLQGLQAENQKLKAQQQDSQLLVNEQHAKCFKLSEDLKSATTELTKRDCTINNLHQELAVSTATKQTELETKLDDIAMTRANLEGRLCRTECSEKELRASESSLKVQLAVQMQTVRMLEEEKKKTKGLEIKIQALENQLKENNKSLEVSSSSSLHQASEIKMLSNAVKDTKNQLKALIEDKMHSALLSQMQEKQGLTDKLTEAISVIGNYEQCFRDESEITKALTEKNQNLEDECKSLTSILEEENQKQRNTQLQIDDLSRKLARESQEKLLLLQDREHYRDWNQNIYHRASSITSSLSSLSGGQSSELLQLRDSSGKLTSDIQVLLKLPSNNINGKDNKPSSILNNWSNSFGGFGSNDGSQQPKTLS